MGAQKADYDLSSGKTVGVDATTLEANAAMRSIVRKDSKQNYPEFLTDLAKASGIETPTREDLAKVDKKRKNKASNDDWENPHDPDAKIAKMKDGTPAAPGGLCADFRADSRPVALHGGRDARRDRNHAADRDTAIAQRSRLTLAVKRLGGG